jgi:hypothetical protein
VVDGDAYTVAAATSNLAFCVDASRMLGPGYEVPSTWRDLASKPFLPIANLTVNGSSSGSSTSSTSSTISPAAGVATPVHLQYHGWPGGGKAIEQSSVALLQYPLGLPMAPSLARADLSYYEALTRTNGFFTGDSIYSIAWLALGRREAADTQWQAAFQHMDTGGGFNTWRETLSG